MMKPTANSQDLTLEAGRWTGSGPMDDLLREALAVLEMKGADYTQGNVDRLANFREVAKATGTTMEQVWFTYFYKHFVSVAQYVKTGKEGSEPIQSRLVDIINYTLLFGLMVDEQSSSREVQKSSEK